MGALSYRQLDVWAKATGVAVLAAAQGMPKQEEYRLTSQLEPLLEETERVARMLNRLHARLKDG